MSEKKEVLVIGAGLSGLYSAWRLSASGYAVTVVEARQRVGGRILSEPAIAGQHGSVDLGPAWVWPQFQVRIDTLAKAFDVGLFKQFTAGDRLYEYTPGSIERIDESSPHADSYRFVGGASSLIDALRGVLPKGALVLGAKVTAVSQIDNAIAVEIDEAGRNRSLIADAVVLAVPPRLAEQSILFRPQLDDIVVQTWRNTATWMASHSKLLFIYDRAFWRDQGLSGEVFSRCGPLTEIYDGSPADESCFALTAFSGLDSRQRQQLGRDNLVEASLSQLERLFGTGSRDTRAIRIMDWAQESCTTAVLDLERPPQHPQYPPGLPRSLWGGRLLLAGSETAREQGGYLEGALESADSVVDLLV